MAWRRRRGGRPKKADAKRRRTTLSGRAPDRDLGSPELFYRKTRVANGSPVPVELVDIGGILAANELIVDEELVTLRMVADWLSRAAVAFSLPQASPGGLWSALLSQAGRTGGWWTSQFGGGNVRGTTLALFRLGELFDHFAAIDQLPALQLVIRIAGNEAHPENAFELARLRHGLQLVRRLQRRGRQLGY
jgi:hypothetical protein